MAASGVLAPVLTAAGPGDPQLAASLGQLDAVLLDPESAPPEAVEAFISRVRASHPSVVFFLLLESEREEEVLGRFSPPWRQRLDHYFRADLDRPIAGLPGLARQVAARILFDQSSGLSSPPT
jgi:hypothetical protein